MKSDQELKRDVMSELAWDPAVQAEAIEVNVEDGVATLAGELASYAERKSVEKAVRRVAGVRGVVLQLEVRLAPAQQRADSDIAKAALAALRWHASVPHERLQLAVDDGWVTLGGDVDWHFQLAAAEQCVRPLVGVRGITNNIAVKPRAGDADPSGEILEALTRHAQQGGRRIDVRVQGGTVTLQGTVGSLVERDAAVAAAAATRGVSNVVDRLSIRS